MNGNDYYTVRGYQLMAQNKKITSAMEDYLEMIYRNRNKSDMRINDLAALLHVRASSATKMVQKLGRMGFLHYEKYGNIAITDKGRDIGAYLLRRHRIIAAFLTLIGTEDVLIETELIEHSVTEQTLGNLEKLNQFFAKNPDILWDFRQADLNKRS